MLIGFAALVIESGRAYKNRRDVQGAADAAAMAAIRELPGSTTLATYQANIYSETKPGATHNLKSIDFAENNTQINVEVEQNIPGGLLSVFSKSSITVSAKASARINHVGTMQGMLPMALMRDNFTLGGNTEVKFDGSATGNRGAVRPDNNPPTCYTTAGAADFRNLIEGEANGGFDACAYAPGDLIQTQTGNMSGPTKQGFDSRLGSNSQTFSDVFELDASTGKYIVKDPTSPRLGIVPVIENTNGTTAWPGGSKDTVVLSYVLVYIGKTDTAGNPAYTLGGKSVWVTPVSAILPSEWENGEIQDYDENSPGQPVIYRLVE